MGILQRMNNCQPPVWVSLHDCAITEIKTEHDPEKVKFIFRNGFAVINNSKVVFSPRGEVVFSGCSSSDFFCKLLREKQIGLSTIVKGRTVCLERIQRLLTTNVLELQEELYSSNHTYWKGVLRQTAKTHRRTRDVVIIETIGAVSISYCWQDTN